MPPDDFGSFFDLTIIVEIRKTEMELKYTNMDFISFSLAFRSDDFLVLKLA